MLAKRTQDKIGPFWQNEPTNHAGLGSLER